MGFLSLLSRPPATPAPRPVDVRLVELPPAPRMPADRPAPKPPARTPSPRPTAAPEPEAGRLAASRSAAGKIRGPAGARDAGARPETGRHSGAGSVPVTLPPRLDGSRRPPRDRRGRRRAARSRRLDLPLSRRRSRRRMRLRVADSLAGQARGAARWAPAPLPAPARDPGGVATPEDRRRGGCPLPRGRERQRGGRADRTDQGSRSQPRPSRLAPALALLPGMEEGKPVTSTVDIRIPISVK